MPPLSTSLFQVMPFVVPGMWDGNGVATEKGCVITSFIINNRLHRAFLFLVQPEIGLDNGMGEGC